MDFFQVKERSRKRGEIEIYPDFLVTRVSDILVRGGSFYGIWDEEKGLWSQDEIDAQELVDKELWKYAEKYQGSGEYGPNVRVLSMKSDSSGTWNRFKQYLKRFPDTSHRLDESITFANTEVTKTSYVSRRLPYILGPGDHSAWDELVSRLYDDENKQKIEWAIGAIVTGESKKIQKFFVLYGAPGTGKGTIIEIIQKLFDGYYTTVNAKALGSNNNQFATEVFKSNPLVAIQHDGKLNRIEDNTMINSIVSHEVIVINEKNKPQYMGPANCFMFIGSNDPVKISDANSGIIRRLIDIEPKNKDNAPIPAKEYDALMSRIDFELGAIADHCREVFTNLGKNYYRNYKPKTMIEKTDVFYNFVEANLEVFEEQSDGMGLKQAYTLYKDYCEDALVEYKLPRYRFREELKNYFDHFYDFVDIDGKRIHSYYKGFKIEKFQAPVLKKEEHALPLVMDETESLLDDVLADCPAQYAKEDGSPEMGWASVTTTLKDLDTTRTHYVLTQNYDTHLIGVDFDLKNDKGEKDMLKNMEAASKWVPTYSEFSKGGCGIHLMYIYDGDPSKLNPIYAKDIEIKVFKGKAALRRRLSKCNGLDIAHLPEGSLPLKEEKVIDTTKLKDELHLRNIIKKCLRKEIHGATRPEIDMIAKVLDDAYNGGLDYDVSDLKHDILVFAMNSSHQSDYCVKKLREMQFMSEARIKAREEEERVAREVVKEQDEDDSDIVFFDIEIYPPGIDEDGEENEGLFLVCWKRRGEHEKVVPMVNPKPIDIEDLIKFKLVGFNNRDYDNHMLYARLLGYNNARLYDLSKRIIVDHARDAKFPEAFDISYTDVYDFASKKQSLKKWEIELGISHIEMGIPWDKPAPKRMWNQIIEYCSNDVIATEAVFENRQEDWVARKILADLGNGKVNDTTNSLTLKIVFGKERKPTLVYTDLATGEQFEGR